MKTRFLLPVILLAPLALILFFVFDGADDKRRPDPGSADMGNTPAEAAEEPEPDLVDPGPEPASKPSMAEPERQQLATDQKPSWPAEETRWIDVQLLLPAQTPADEVAWIIALDKPMTADKLYARHGPFAQLHAGLEPASVEGLQAAVQADALGLARLGLGPEMEESWLAVGGAYLYSQEAQRLDLEGDATSVELRPELGAWISGRLLAPSDQADLDLSAVEVKLRWSAAANIQLGAASVSALRRNRQPSADGRFEFRAIPTGKTQALSTESESLAHGFGEDVNPRPGEHLRIDLALFIGGSIQGRVVDGAGQGVAEVEVQVLGRMFFGNPTALLREAETDQEGNYHLKGVSPGLVLLRVHDSGYQDVLSSPFELADGEARDYEDITLDEGLAIAGTVFFPDGRPASDTLVKIEPDLSENLTGSSVDQQAYLGANNSATVDADGNFRITGAGVGPWSLSALLTVPEGAAAGSTAPGLWSANREVLRAPSEELELVLAPPMYMIGQALDSQGAAVTPFTVSSKRAGTQWYMPPSESLEEEFEAEDGRFRLIDLRAGDWTFMAQAEGYADSVEIKLELPSEEPLEFKLLKPVSLAGSVVDADGRPVVGAEVSQELVGTQVFEAAQGRGDWPKTESDAEGQFRLAGLPPGAGSVLAKKDGYAPSLALPFEAQEGEQVVDLVLTLRRGATLTGEVFGADGKPAAACMVILQKPDVSERRILNASAQGTFDERGLTPGNWQVQAFPGLTSLQSETGEMLDQATLMAALKMKFVELEDEKSEHVLLGEPPASPVRVHGRVDLGGSSPEQAVISFLPASAGGMGNLKIAQLDAAGVYSVQLDEPGDYLVTVQIIAQAGRQNSLEYRRSIPKQEEYAMDIELPLGRISGKVQGPGGAPLVGARVTLNIEGGLVFGTVLGGHYSETASDENGNFDIAFLRPGSYSLAAGGAPLGGILGKDNGLGRAVKSVALKAGQWVQDVTFELQTPGSVKGTVRDGNGALVQGASIFMRDEDGRLIELFSAVQTNASGSFEYSSMAPGEYTLTARNASLASDGNTLVRVRAGEASEVTVVVEAGTMLLVTLSDKGGGDVPSRVSVLDAAGRELNGMLGASEILERYSSGAGSSVQRVGPVPAGVYRVRAFAEDGRSVERKVTVRGKPERKIKLRMK